MTHVLYKVTYLPHLESGRNPKYYVGSKFNLVRSYLGSPASKQVFDYTEGLTLKEWWKKETREYPERFRFEVIKEYKRISKEDLVLREHALHQKLKIKGEEFFNQGLATKGFVSKKKGTNTKAMISEKIRLFWASPAGEEKRARLIHRNRTTHPAKLREKWKNPTKAMLLAPSKRKPISEETRMIMSASASKRWSEGRGYIRPLQRIKVYDRIYPSAKHAAKVLGYSETWMRKIGEYV